jgi:hypothetical protein
VQSGSEAAPDAARVSPAVGAAPELPPPAYDEPPAVLRGFTVTGAAVRAGVVAAAEPEIRLQSGDLVSVIATVNITRKSAKIQSVNRVPKGIAETATGPEEATVRFVDANGRTIKSHTVILRRDTDIPAEEDQTGLIDAVLPFASGTAKIEVLLFGEVVDTRAVSMNAPKVRNLKGARAPAAAGVAIARAVFTWEATDADNDALTYTVQSSHDGGKTWQTIAVGLTEPKLEIDPQSLGDTATVLLRVIANDGVNNAVVTIGQPFKLR